MGVATQSVEAMYRTLSAVRCAGRRSSYYNDSIVRLYEGRNDIERAPKFLRSQR